MNILSVSRERVRRAKKAFVTRRVPEERMRTLITGNVRPRVGDLLLARVLQIGQHARLELADGRRAQMFVDDEIIVCFGNRYAPDQFEGVIGVDLSPCNLVAAGGIASVELCRHDRMRAASQISPVGLLGSEKGIRLNVRDYAIVTREQLPRIPVILSLGTSMNSGKTLTATSVMRGLRRAGLKVASLKITGTGAGGDTWLARDAGADLVLDFTDAGFATTYLAPVPEIEAGTFRLLNHAEQSGCDIAVVEIADGLHQFETAALLALPSMLQMTIGVTFASYDSLGAASGVGSLRAAGFDVLGISGRLGRSPLSVREAEHSTGLRVYSPMALQYGALMPAIIAAARARLQTSPSNPFLRRLANLRDRERIELRAGFMQNVAGAIQSVWAPALCLVAERAMMAEANALCGAPFRTRSDGRLDRRSGFRLATWKTNAGVVKVRVPRLRRRRYRPSFLKVHDLPIADLESIARLGGSEESLQSLSALVHTLGVSLPASDLLALNDELRSLQARQDSAFDFSSPSDDAYAEHGDVFEPAGYA